MGIYLFMHKKKFNFVSWPTVDLDLKTERMFYHTFEQPEVYEKTRVEFCLKTKIENSSKWVNLFKIWKISNASFGCLFIFDKPEECGLSDLKKRGMLGNFQTESTLLCFINIQIGV